MTTPAKRAFLVAAIVLVPVAARAVPPPAQQVMELLDEWRVEEAARVSSEFLGTHMSDPSAQFVAGMVEFHQGDYARSVKSLDKAIEGAPAEIAIEWRATRDLVARTDEATRGYVEERSPDGHFLIRHAPGRDALLVPYMARALDAARREIAEHDFDAAKLLGDPVRVEIYPSTRELSRVSPLTEREIETSGTIALCKYNRLMIVSPRALDHGYPWLDTVVHEFTHFVVSKVSRNTVPIWFQEGLAKFEERRWRQGPGGGLSPTSEHLLATALGRSKRLITFEEMYPSMAKLPSQADTALAFAEVYTVVEYLYGKKGWGGVRQVIEQMKGGNGDASAVAAVMGQSFDDFQRDWKTWLRGRKLRTHPGLVPSSLKFKKLDKDDGKERDDSQDITEERARKLARLGGMLRERARMAAAAVEYEKAQALVGAANPVVANHLARTYLDLGKADRAIGAAQPALELYPDSGGLAATLGEAWLAKGDKQKAVPQLEAAIAVNPFAPRPHCLLAPLYREAHDARADVEQAACEKLGQKSESR